jgi:hypothetical protein
MVIHIQRVLLRLQLILFIMSKDLFDRQR